MNALSGNSSTTNQSPNVSLTSSATNVTAGSNITLTASASDTDGTISLLEIYNGSTLLGSATTGTYNYLWQNVQTGNYTVTAKATDNLGASRTSAPIAINVTAGGNSGGNNYLINIGGQSNAEGANATSLGYGDNVGVFKTYADANISPSPFRTYSRVKILNETTLEWEAFQPTVNDRANGVNAAIGIADEFERRYSTGTLYLTVVAQGAQNIVEWDYPSGRLYTRTKTVVGRARTLLAQAGISYTTINYWDQGEANVNDTTQYYLDKLTAVFNNYVTDGLRAANDRVILAGFHGYLQNVEQAQNQYVTANSFAKAFALTGLAGNADNLHFSARVQYLIGRVKVWSEIIGSAIALPFPYFSQVPSIASTNVSSGAAGSTVVLTGTNFYSVSSVLFGTAPAIAYTVNSPTQITVTIPANAGSGSQPITVTTPGGRSAARAFSVSGTSTGPTGPIPIFNSALPSSAAAGQSVRFGGGPGDAMAAVTSVKIGGVEAQSFSLHQEGGLNVVVANGTPVGLQQMVATTAGNQTGTYQLTVIEGGAKPVTNYNGLNPEQYSDFVFNGYNYDTVTSVVITASDGLKYTCTNLRFEAGSDTKFLAFVPRNTPTGAGTVTVTNSGGPATFDCTIKAAPAGAPQLFSGAQPNSGARGTTTRISGYFTRYNQLALETVKVGGAVAQWTLGGNYVEITIPQAAPSGAVKIGLTNPDGTSETDFTVV
ncbi:hypothetical protein F1C16_05235 [Hymenobacter sp. NBH84]|uniref:Ig-like domain-containing protein n=1 Tax=Hymenobacter sp. NBH84 TaxID=2596915 RepID=UPI00162679B9|nr:Ig-like domain-containing protein [Hymenobacter sp. NBH84]QNE38999.1 hypothetical protein F1C16_05235 [Hymenobacter sp. NBH84]